MCLYDIYGMYVGHFGKLSKFKGINTGRTLGANTGNMTANPKNPQKTFRAFSKVFDEKSFSKPLITRYVCNTLHVLP